MQRLLLWALLHSVQWTNVQDGRSNQYAVSGRQTKTKHREAVAFFKTWVHITALLRRDIAKAVALYTGHWLVWNTCGLIGNSIHLLPQLLERSLG